MYCKYCGSELPMGSSFCPNCSKEVKEGYLKQAMNKSDIANYVGKNEAYFSREFSNVAAGQKGSFNWVAFWFGPFYCVYRKQYDILWKYFKVPMSGFLISSLGITIQIFDGNMDIDTLLKWTIFWLGLSFVATVWLYVAQVRVGKNFNRLYFESWKKKIAEKKSLKEYGVTSVKNVVLFGLLSSFLLSMPVIAIVKTQVFPALYSSNSYDIVEEADANEVVYGYNTYNPGVDIDEYANAEIKGHYITDTGTGFSLDENLCLNIYADGHLKGEL
ncbi:MAG: zinc ribbon domain-containing protein, partial [Anaerotignaceae bacterium]